MASLNYHIGAALSGVRHQFLAWSGLPLLRAVPFGVASWYDAQRILGNRRFDVVFDVGANVGQTLRSLARYFPGTEIHCFEPASEAYRQLAVAAKRYPRVQTHQLAFGKAQGSAPLYLGKEPASELSTLSQAASEELTLDHSEQVDIETIDAFCDARRIESIDLLKLDVQGWELDVLAGADALLNRGQILFVYAEAAFSEKSATMIPFSALNAVMLQRGFVFSGLYEQFRWGDRSEVYFANALYTNPQRLRERRART